MIARDPRPIAGGILAFCALALLWLVVRGITAAFGAAPANSDPDLAPWFEAQRNPVTGAFCCSIGDGHILSNSSWRETDDGPEILRDGAWQAVPPDAILHGTANPTGGAVAFYLPGGSILCFVYPSMT